MTKEIAHFFWEGEISKLEIASIQSFIKHGFDVYVWSYNGLVIDGATSKDANEILPRNYVDILEMEPNSVTSRFAKTSKLSILAGALRLEIVNKYNGWWFDTDCFCLKNQSTFKELRRGKQVYTAAEEPNRFASGAFYAEKEGASELMNRGRQVFSSGEKYKWGDFGPNLFTTYVTDNTLNSEMGDVGVFYAISYEEMNLYLDPGKISEAMRKTKKSYVTHVWCSILVNFLNVDKNNPPAGSYLAHLCQT